MGSEVLLKFRRLVKDSDGLLRTDEMGPLVLPARVAEEIVRQMMSDLLAVIGGDLWIRKGASFERVHDWSCEKAGGEAPESFSHRSMLLALGQIRQMSGKDIYVDLVVKDALTGEIIID